MYKLILYEDDDKVMDLETSDFVLIFDVVISIVNAVNIYRERMKND